MVCVKSVVEGPAVFNVFLGAGMTGMDEPWRGGCWHVGDVGGGLRLK